jgi:hypothetical protein
VTFADIAGNSLNGLAGRVGFRGVRRAGSNQEQQNGHPKDRHTLCNFHAAFIVVVLIGEECGADEDKEGRNRSGPGHGVKIVQKSHPQLSYAQIHQKFAEKYSAGDQVAMHFAEDGWLSGETPRGAEASKQG